MDLYEELKTLIDKLHAEEIEYALCGGIAVALYGYVRFTYDLDILVRDEDTSRIASVVKSIGYVFDAGAYRLAWAGTIPARFIGSPS